MGNKSKVVIVTGGAGFIGSHLTKSLVKRGYRIIVLDDLSTGKMANLEGLLERQNVEFVQGSIADIALLQRIIRGAYYVFHQAAIPSVTRSIENPRASNETNITGILNVLLAARDNNVRKVVFASSSSVYGDTPKLPKVEDMVPNPQSPYAVTKIVGEYYCRVFHKVYGLPTVSLRYFNVYGPGQDPNSQYAAVIPKFIMSIAKNKPPIIFGDGEQSRDFTFVKDVVEANILAAESNANGIFNVGSGASISLNQLAQFIIKLMQKDSIKPNHVESRSGDVKHSLADISKAGIFGYKPRYNLDEGLKKTIRSFQYA